VKAIAVAAAKDVQYLSGYNQQGHMNIDNNQDLLPIIDLSVHGEVRDLLGDEFAVLIDAYLEDTEQFVQAMQDACDCDDLNAIEMPAHSMKSSSANVGKQILVVINIHMSLLIIPRAMRLSSLARELEEKIRSGNHDGVLIQVAAVVEEFARVSRELSQ